MIQNGRRQPSRMSMAFRVYLNEGTCSDYWLTLHDPLLGRTPLKLLANLDSRETPRILQQKLNSDLGGKVLSSLVEFIPDKVLTPLLLKYNQAPDFIEDHGHDFGTDLPDEDKRALIEFLKTF